MNVYVFDVDGTLTPSRLQIDNEFRQFFLNWMRNKKVIFVTGSDKEKTIEQIGYDVWKSASACLQCAGNHIFINDEEVYKLDWTPSEELINFAIDVVRKSKYHTKTSNFVEPRIGLLNVSIVGRNCTQQQREDYFKWDSETGERDLIVNQIHERFPDMEASSGGQISIDIHPKGKNKSQAKDWILNKWPNAIIHFFGDKMAKGGNDFDLAEVLHSPHTNHSVKDWKDTYEKLKTIK